MSEVVDLEVGRYALRTFRFTETELVPLVDHGVPTWINGTCVAECLPWLRFLGGLSTHPSPALHCTCGVYGSFSYEDLVTQYDDYARALTCVISAEGQTIIGSRGLRTQAARVVAYHSNPNVRVSPVVTDLMESLWRTMFNGMVTYLTNEQRAEICERSLPGAKHYDDLAYMLHDFGLSHRSPIEDSSGDCSPAWWTA